MFGFKGVGDYERGVARQERVAPFSLRAYFYTQRTQPTFCLPKCQARGARDAPPLRFFAAYGSIRGDFQPIPISSSSFFFFFRAVCLVSSASCLTFFAFTSSNF